MNSKTIEKVFLGNIIHCTSLKLDGFQLLENYLIGIQKDGIIAFIGPNFKKKEYQEKFSFNDSQIIKLEKKFLIPGFIDTHIHAPQYPNSGTGTDLQLLEWLQKYTFPTEAKYLNLQFASDIFTKIIKRILSYGTTTACYFSSIHLEATKLLVDIIHKYGQRSFIGKVNMDRNSPDFYIEKAQDSLQQTEDFIKYVKNEIKSSLITPVITPRFVPTCSPELMKGLGELAKKYDVPIQSHISENKNEIKWVKELHPDLNSYTQVYDYFGLLNKKTIMAHGIYLSNDELKVFKEKEVGISHCPISNFSLHSGILDVRNIIEKGIKLGLGTDISGGYSPSLLVVIRQAIIASNSLQFQKENYQPINYKEAFALATLGGSQVLGLEKKIGNFLVGKEFDALIINPYNSEVFDIFSSDSLEDIFQKFIYLGDDRNIEEVYIQGKKISF